jgi:predicted nucleotidyltransferase
MKTNSDFKDLLHDLNGAGVRYLIVGGYAVMVHTEPRYTKDLDVWIDPTESNARMLLAALAEFGAPTASVVPSDFTEPDVFYQIGVEPVRVDIMTSVPGLDFAPAWDRRKIVDFGGELAPVLCREDALKSKIAAGRARDRRDAAKLARGNRERRPGRKK